MQFRRGRPEEPEVNITSLVDVVFLLLIFFMVTTTFNKFSQLNVQLPQADGKPATLKQKRVEITIDAKGRYFVNGQEVINTREETLKRALRKAAAGIKNPQIILSADRMTTHQAVVTAMDAAQQLGFVHLTFATSRPPEDR